MCKQVLAVPGNAESIYNSQSRGREHSGCVHMKPRRVSQSTCFGTVKQYTEDEMVKNMANNQWAQQGTEKKPVRASIDGSKNAEYYGLHWEGDAYRQPGAGAGGQS